LANVIEVSALRKSFGQQKVLDGLTFSAGKGEILGFLGPSGSGKTTFLRILMGLESPDGGYAQILGVDSRDASEARRNFGFVPQQDVVYDELTVGENVDYFGMLYGLEKAERIDRGGELLRRVDLWEKRDALAVNLSGGQRKRLNFVLSLLHDPKVLLVDEPTVGLDPVTTRFVWKLLSDLKRGGCTILMTTHYMNEAETVCDRIAILNKGRVAAIGTLAQLKREMGGKGAPTLEDIFFIATGRKPEQIGDKPGGRVAIA
jgi:ABC-2 type transport system ATP-binding protein